MTGITYVRYDLLSGIRNWRFMFFSLLFPLVMFLTIAGNNRHATLDGISLPVYYMTGMASWGTMSAVVASGARIAIERSLNWHRQLRLTPLSVRTFFASKALAGYLMAALTVVVLAMAGAAIGVRIGVLQWLEMSSLVLAGLVPFIALGIVVGLVVTVDSMGPVLGGLVSLFALFGGAWGPLATGGVMREVAEVLPSYWLVQTGRVGVGEGGWPPKGWIVVLVWSVVLTAASRWAYRRDASRQ